MTSRDVDAPDTLDWPGPASSPMVLVDLPRPTDGHTPPTPPEVFDAITKTLGIQQDTDADALSHE
ncbi:hypothetical protein [Streptomyces sp. NPDC059479]|uniref:hypothetical protein n=1 Tax=Streptomyces sp. NPDC059479 TaxID=3346848 RepID=UPI0036762A2E